MKHYRLCPLPGDIYQFAQLLKADHDKTSQPTK